MTGHNCQSPVKGGMPSTWPPLQPVSGQERAKCWEGNWYHECMFIAAFSKRADCFRGQLALQTTPRDFQTLTETQNVYGTLPNPG